MEYTLPEKEESPSTNQGEASSSHENGVGDSGERAKDAETISSSSGDGELGFGIIDLKKFKKSVKLMKDDCESKLDEIRAFDSLSSIIAGLIADPMNPTWKRIDLNCHFYGPYIEKWKGGRGVMEGIGFLSKSIEETSKLENGTAVTSCREFLEYQLPENKLSAINRLAKLCEARSIVGQAAVEARNQRVVKKRRDKIYNEMSRDMDKDELPRKRLKSSDGTAIDGKEERKNGSGTTLVCNCSARFFVGHADTVGRRLTMEDRMTVCGVYRKNQVEDFFALFDGHGGGEASEFASKNLHVELESLLNEGGTDPGECLKQAFMKVNSDIATQDIVGGTTVVAVYIRETEGWVAHVGDSRALIARPNGSVVVLTEDHKPDKEKEKKRIEKVGGFITGNESSDIGIPRTNGLLGVSRAIGNIHLQPAVSPEPYILKFKVSPLPLSSQSQEDLPVTQPLSQPNGNGEIVFSPSLPKHSRIEAYSTNELVTLYVGDSVVLACDGVFDVLSDETVAEVGMKALWHSNDSSGTGRSIETAASVYAAEAATSILKTAWNKGSMDNISVFVGAFAQAGDGSCN